MLAVPQARLPWVLASMNLARKVTHLVMTYTSTCSRMGDAVGSASTSLNKRGSMSWCRTHQALISKRMRCSSTACTVFAPASVGSANRPHKRWQSSSPPESAQRCHGKPATLQLLLVVGRHLRALVRLDHRDEPTEQLPTQQALYRGRKLRHDLLGRVHVAGGLVEGVNVNDNRRHALVEAPTCRHRPRNPDSSPVQPRGGQSSVEVVLLLRVGAVQGVPSDAPHDVDHQLPLRTGGVNTAQQRAIQDALQRTRVATSSTSLLDSVLPSTAVECVAVDLYPLKLSAEHCWQHVPQAYRRSSNTQTAADSPSASPLLLSRAEVKSPGVKSVWKNERTSKGCVDDGWLVT